MKYSKEFVLELYRKMKLIRCFEECVKRDHLAHEIKGPAHLYIGEEAIATGICAALRKDDQIESTHRGHGHCIAKGADIKGMMAEIYGKEAGLCSGRGGSMHIADFSVGMLGANGVVGGGFNLAVGAALANSRILLNDKVSVVFYGDGAANRGTFHEAINVASAWKLPVVFVNEANGWASTTPTNSMCNVDNLSERAKGYGIPGVTVNGQDVFEVYDASKEAVDRARRGEGPTIIEAKTYRIEGHYIGDPELYRDPADSVRILNETDPIKVLEVILTEDDTVYAEACCGQSRVTKLKRSLSVLGVTKEELSEIDEECIKAVREAREFAHETAYPESDTFMKYVYAD